MLVDNPNIKFIHDRKKNVGASKYKRVSKNNVKSGKKSKKKLKNKNSATKKILPGNPKKTNKLVRMARNSLGHKKFTPLISVIKRVLNRLLTASTNKNEFVDNNA